MWKNHLSCIEYKGINDIRQTEIHMGKHLAAKSTAIALFMQRREGLTAAITEASHGHQQQTEFYPTFFCRG